MAHEDRDFLVCSFPPYPSYRTHPDGTKRKRPILDWLYYTASTVIGFSIWHKGNHGCETFPRGPGVYEAAAKAVAKDELLQKMVQDSLAMHSLYNNGAMPLYCGAVAFQAIAHQLEVERFSYHYRVTGRSLNRRKREERLAVVAAEALNLATNPVDNLLHVHEYDALVRMIAACLNRRLIPWWKHPRWHVHHWRFNFELPRNIRRAFFEKCIVCRTAIGWGKSPTADSRGSYHCDCYPSTPVNTPAVVTADHVIH
jgi:hypothetical protein